jgi:putative transposase
LGRLLVVVVHAASIQESDGAKLVLRRALGRFPRLRRIWADQGYKPHFVEWAKAIGHWVVEIVARPEGTKGFHVLPRRWVVERTFAWLGRCRRLSKDYEGLPETSEAWVHLAMIHLMLKRLAPP